MALTRTFDSIVYSKLLTKLSAYGIDGKLLGWLSAFLHYRTQCVVIENCFSSVADVISGVPQGSVLDPVLFLIFINDIESICCGETDLKLFADDLKLYSSVTIDSPLQSLQQSIDNLVDWATRWQLEINISKCATFTVGTTRGNNSIYTTNNKRLNNVDSIADLGVEIDSNLSYQAHIANIVSKATQRVGVLFRGFVTRDIKFMRKAFVSYIRPILEYNSVVWNPYTKDLTMRIEKVQRRFTKWIPSLGPYNN